MAYVGNVFIPRTCQAEPALQKKLISKMLHWHLFSVQKPQDFNLKIICARGKWRCRSITRAVQFFIATPTISFHSILKFNSPACCQVNRLWTVTVWKLIQDWETQYTKGSVRSVINPSSFSDLGDFGNGKVFRGGTGLEILFEVATTRALPAQVCTFFPILSQWRCAQARMQHETLLPRDGEISGWNRTVA